MYYNTIIIAELKPIAYGVAASVYEKSQFVWSPAFGGRRQYERRYHYQSNDLLGILLLRCIVPRHPDNNAVSSIRMAAKEKKKRIRYYGKNNVQAVAYGFCCRNENSCSIRNRTRRIGVIGCVCAEHLAHATCGDQFSSGHATVRQTHALWSSSS